MTARGTLLAPAIVAIMAITTAPAIAIVDGEETTGDWNVVAIVVDGHAACTGTLVAPRLVLTAGHCAALEPTHVYFGFAPELGGAIVTLAHVRIHPSFQRALLRDDLALLLLARPAPAPATPARLLDRDLDASFIGATVRLVGFGHLSSGGDGEHVKREGTARLDDVGERELRYVPAPSMTCLGDSGGPAFLTIDGTEHVAGVGSYGDPSCTEFGGATRVDRYLDSFITPYLVATADGAAAVGERCFHPGNCAAGATCLSEPDGFAYCTATCAGDAACPESMSCRDGSCRFETPPGGAGSACTPGGLDCADGNVCGVAALAPPGAPPTCLKACSLGPVSSCDAGWACRTAIAEEDGHERFACLPLEPAASETAGCSSSSGDPRPATAPLAFVLAALVARRRNRSRSNRRQP